MFPARAGCATIMMRRLRSSKIANNLMPSDVSMPAETPKPMRASGSSRPRVMLASGTGLGRDREDRGERDECRTACSDGL
jgi:hypothetical protein